MEQPFNENNSVAKAEKAKYYKGINHNNLIVKFIADTDGDHFDGIVVESDCDYPVGLQSDTWYNPLFEPCDYTEQDTPVTEQPRSDLELRAKKRIPLEDKLHAILREAIDEVERLEQENAQLKQNNEGISNLYRAALDRVAELETELGTRAKQSAEPKEPVYDAKWLANVVKNYDDIYCLDGANINVGGITLSAKDSAPIIMAALAKHVNPLFEADNNFSWEIMYKNSDYSPLNYTIGCGICGSVFTSKAAAQKAIEILTTHFPGVLKNYLN